MRRHILILLAALTLTPACSKDDKKGGGGGGGGKAGAIKVDQAKLGTECSSSMDCGMLDFDAECRFECSKATVDSATGYCQLINIVATAGTKGCFGNRRGSGTSGSTPGDKTPIVNYCDIDAGVYCDMGTHECLASKAIGAACKDNDECGKDGACQAGACVAAGAPGAAAVEGRCNASAYFKGDQCIARVADGGVCEESDQCQSLSCVYGTTKACGPSKRKSCSL